MMEKVKYILKELKKSLKEYFSILTIQAFNSSFKRASSYQCAVFVFWHIIFSLFTIVLLLFVVHIPYFAIILIVFQAWSLLVITPCLIGRRINDINFSASILDPSYTPKSAPMKDMLGRLIKPIFGMLVIVCLGFFSQAPVVSLAAIIVLLVIVILYPGNKKINNNGKPMKENHKLAMIYLAVSGVICAMISAVLMYNIAPSRNYSKHDEPTYVDEQISNNPFNHRHNYGE